MDCQYLRKHPTQQTILFVILIQFMCFVVASNHYECGRCSCLWISSKITANCTNLGLKTIPRDLSNTVQSLDLSNNLIPEIKRDEFTEADLENVHKLILKNCTLLELNRDAFNNLKVLIEINLSDNMLRELHRETFNGVVRLRILILNNNELEYLPEGLFNGLVYLKNVEFKNNRIVRIAPRTFENLPELSAIDLSYNKLTVQRVNSFVDLPKLTVIYLEGNPWNCTCRLLEFRKYIVDRRIYAQPTDCLDPVYLRKKLWTDVPLDKFACRPEIIQSHKEIVMNENTTLTCRVRAAPEPKFVWTNNKRLIRPNDRRFRIHSSVEPDPLDDMYIYNFELNIIGTRRQDKGMYACQVENVAGIDIAEIELLPMAMGHLDPTADEEQSSNLFLIICIVAIILLLLLIIVALALCCYCRRTKQFSKGASMSDNILMTSKLDKIHNNSMLEGSVITEVQKSLLTSVNPVEKPPRRANDLESLDTDDGHDMKKTLLDETTFGSHDEETHSVALSDSTPRSRQAFVDDSHGTNLPPDLLSFQAKVPQSPSIQSSISNIPDNRIYAKSPLASPVYQGVPNQNELYGIAPVAFRTLQHPKNRNLAVLNSPRNNNASPFVPAPIVYPQVVMKQGYMTIPRKPRVPSWTPSCSTTFSEFQPIGSVAEGSLTGTEVEPVYDNLGVRTTAAGNSSLNLTKIGTPTHNSTLPNRYTMKDRPLPATPSISLTPGSNAGTPSRIYEPIQEVANLSVTTEPLYGTAKNGGHGVTIVPSSTNGFSVGGNMERIAKIPPRPPPKPKKKIPIPSMNQGSTSQLFEDEGEDGTEV